MVMQRESPRALVLNPSGEISGAHAPPGIFVLDKAFVLIEGHPVTCARGERFSCLHGQFRGENVHGREAALAQGAQAQRVVALGQAAAIVVYHQAAMEP